MVYNEPDYLPIWLRHYARQVGTANCYVIDHGTDDGSTDGYGEVSFIRLPRTPLDEDKRVALVASIVSFLLSIYDAVIHTDVDEIVFADPRRHAELHSFCQQNDAAVVTAYGFDIHQAMDSEPALDLARPILEQRRWVRFSAAMCKPVLVRKPVVWAPGFHCTSDDPIAMSELYLFHLRWVDLDVALRRLARSRAQPWADPNAGAWHRVPDSDYENMFRANSGLPRREDGGLMPGVPPLKDAVDRFLHSQIGRETECYKISLDIPVHELWRIPDEFRHIF